MTASKASAKSIAIAPVVNETVEPQIEETASTPNDGNKGTVLKQVKATDEVKGLNINKRPNFETNNGVTTIEGAEENFQLVDYDMNVLYPLGTFGRLFEQHLRYPCSMYGGKCVPETQLEMAQALGIPEVCMNAYSGMIQTALGVILEKSEDLRVKEMKHLVTVLRDHGFSESNITALISPQKGVKDSVFRPTFSTRTFTMQRDEKNDLVVTVQFDKESDKTTFLKEYASLNDILKAFASQKSAGYKTLPDFLTAKTALCNGTAKVEIKERKAIETHVSDDELGI